MAMDRQTLARSLDAGRASTLNCFTTTADIAAMSAEVREDDDIGPLFRNKYLNPTFPIYHPNSWKSYHFPTAKGTVSPMQPSDGMILVIGPRLEGHSVIFLAIQTHLSCRFLLAVDSLGLRRSGSSSQIINQAQDFPEQVPRHRHLSQLERNVAAMSDNLGPDLHQLVAQRRHRPVLHLLRQSQCPHEIAQIVGQGVKLEPNGIVAELAT